MKKITSVLNSVAALCVALVHDLMEGSQRAFDTGLSLVECCFPLVESLRPEDVGIGWQPDKEYYFLDDMGPRFRQRIWAVIALDRRQVSFWRRRQMALAAQAGQPTGQRLTRFVQACRMLVHNVIVHPVVGICRFLMLERTAEKVHEICAPGDKAGRTAAHKRPAARPTKGYVRAAQAPAPVAAEEGYW